MTPEFTFWIFLLAVGKALVYTGIGPAILIVYAAEKLVNSVGWVPTRKQWETWRVRRKQFLSWGERTASKSLQERAAYLEAGARPSNLKGAA